MSEGRPATPRTRVGYFEPALHRYYHHDMKPGVTRELAANIAALTYDNIPPSIVAATHLLPHPERPRIGARENVYPGYPRCG